MMRRDVFVSYSQPDKDVAFEVVAHIEAAGISCWVAPRDITPAAEWAAEIIEAISAARIMVLLFSASANGSPQVRREVERAVHKQVAVLPFRIENVLPSDSLEYFLGTRHWLDAFPAPREPHYERLCAHLTRFLQNTAGSTSVNQLRALAIDSPNVDVQPRVPVFSDAELQYLEEELAVFIGPIAKYLVERTAAQTATLDELLIRLGAEIASGNDRRRFIEACKQIQGLRT
jgi:TIR domain